MKKLNLGKSLKIKITSIHEISRFFLLQFHICNSAKYIDNMFLTRQDN